MLNHASQLHQYQQQSQQLHQLPPLTIPTHAATAAAIGGMSPPATSVMKRCFTKSGVVHRKKCRHPKTAADMLHRFCLVCGAKAENYNFGVISCESCKAFFRRNAHKKTLGEAGFGCSFQHGRCDINLASRKKCPGCRLAKCFRVGMKADLIQKGEIYIVGDGVPTQVITSQSPGFYHQHQRPHEFHPAGGITPTGQHQQQHQPQSLPLPPTLQGPASLQLPTTASSNDSRQSPANATNWQALWYHLHHPVRSDPSPITDIGYNEIIDASDKKYANVLLVDFIEELRQLVADTMLANMATPSMLMDPLQVYNSVTTNVVLLEVFVRQAVVFVRRMRQINLLERQHFLQLIKARIHSVIFPLSCAGYSHADSRFYFTINGQRICCQPIEMFSDLVRQSGNRLVDYSPLSDFRTYSRYLVEATEMRHDLLALFCATKLLHLPPDCGITDQRLIGACKRLSLRYHQHLTDTLFYHFPFDFEDKLQLTCRLFKWSEEFDSTLDKFILYCPLHVDDRHCQALQELRAREPVPLEQQQQQQQQQQENSPNGSFY